VKIRLIFSSLLVKDQKQTIFYAGEIADVPDAQAKDWIREGRAEPAPKATATAAPQG
jgi:hypothetical protein